MAQHLPNTDKEAAALREVAEALAHDYPQLSADELAGMIEHARAAFCDRPIRDFIPLLVERRIRHRLDAAD